MTRSSLDRRPRQASPTSERLKGFLMTPDHPVSHRTHLPFHAGHSRLLLRGWRVLRGAWAAPFSKRTKIIQGKVATFHFMIRQRPPQAELDLWEMPWARMDGYINKPVRIANWQIYWENIRSLRLGHESLWSKTELNKNLWRFDEIILAGIIFMKGNVPRIISYLYKIFMNWYLHKKSYINKSASWY